MVVDLVDTVESAHTIDRTSARSSRVEVLPRAERRRSWTAKQKLAIVGESLGPDLTPTEVTRKHQISTGQIYTWRQQFLSCERPAVSRMAPHFTAVELAPACPPAHPPLPELAPCPSIIAPPRPVDGGQNPRLNGADLPLRLSSEAVAASSLESLRRVTDVLGRARWRRGSGICDDIAASACQTWGKHGVDRNRQVLYRRRAPHRVGHECRTSILPMRAFVYVAAAMPRLFLAVCSCAPVAASRSSSAAAAIGGRSTATADALGGHGGGPCKRLASDIRRASVAGSFMPPEWAATGRDRRK
jgi:hypothetical protein